MKERQLLAAHQHQYHGYPPNHHRQHVLPPDFMPLSSTGASSLSSSSSSLGSAGCETPQMRAAHRDSLSAFSTITGTGKITEKTKNNATNRFSPDPIMRRPAFSQPVTTMMNAIQFGGDQNATSAAIVASTHMEDPTQAIPPTISVPPPLPPPQPTLASELFGAVTSSGTTPAFAARQSIPGHMEQGFVFPPPFPLRSPTSAAGFAFPGGPPGLVPLSPIPGGFSLSLPSPQTIDLSSCQGQHLPLMGAGDRPAQAYDAPALAGFVSASDIFSLPVTPRTPITPTVRYAQMHAAQAAGQLMATSSGDTLATYNQLVTAAAGGSFPFDQYATHLQDLQQQQQQQHSASMTSLNQDPVSSGAGGGGGVTITLSPPPKSKPLSRSSSFTSGAGNTKMETTTTGATAAVETDETGKELWRPY